MAMSFSRVKQVDFLTTSQIARFKRDGFLVLPGVLDPDLCRRARDEMWAVIEANLPRMKRHAPATWGPISAAESEPLRKAWPEGEGAPNLGLTPRCIREIFAIAAAQEGAASAEGDAGQAAQALLAASGDVAAAMQALLAASAAAR